MLKKFFHKLLSHHVQRERQKLLKLVELIYLQTPPEGSGGWYGAELARQTGILSGNLYPILGKLVQKGILTKTCEIGNTVLLERPLRCFYTITPEGVRWLEEQRAACRNR